MYLAILPQLTWRWQRIKKTIGLYGLLAMLMSIGCSSVYYFLFSPLESRVLTLQKDARSLRDQSRKKTALLPMANPANQLASFYQFFPTKADISEDMAKLYNAGSQQGLVFEKGDYKLLRERDLRLMRYDIVLPVRGGYPQLRQFIAQALDDLPNLAMEGISFTRQKAGDTSVDAQIHFSLYVSEL